MSNFQPEMDNFEVERALAALETGPTGRLLAAAREEVQPRPEFVRQVETRLRSSSRIAAARAPWMPWRPKNFALAGATLLAVVLAAALFWLNGAAPVSAQQVLDRAAAGKMAPNQILHRSYRLQQTNLGPHTGSGEVWVQADDAGNVTHSAMTLKSFEDDGAVASIQRIVLNGPAAQKFDYRANDNTLSIREGTYAEVNGGDPNLFDGSSVAQYLGRIAQGSVHGVQLLPAQTFDGAQVLAIRVASPNPNSTTYPDQGYTAYFDPQSYALRGMEIPGGRIWMTLEEAVSAASLPENTFALNPPPNARVTQDNTTHNQAGVNVELQTLLEFCHISQAALDTAQAKRTSPLAVCQSGRPGTTGAELLDALLAPVQAQWAAAVAAGKMTAAQKAEYSVNVQKKLAIWITGPLGQ